ncbi:MAG: acyl-CoA thioesterase [Burkholderiales bacterium]|nr:acyl-CoA thioesterase [Burkholderiales bacterium]
MTISDPTSIAPATKAAPVRGRVFLHDQLVRFSHCDPAGIVYYPAFLDLAHATKEDWFTQGLDYSHFALIRERNLGTPTVNLQCDFFHTVEMGNTLRFELRAVKVGGSSMQYELLGKVGDTECLKILQTVVFMHLHTRKAVPIPPDLRPRIEAYLPA